MRSRPRRAWCCGLPGFGRPTNAQLQAGGEYLAERYRALFAIGVGEVILTIGSSLTTRGFAAAQTVAFVVTFAVTALIWRIYIFRAGEEIGLAIQRSANPDLLGTLAAYAHLVMIAGLVVTSVGVQLVIAHPLGPPRVTATVTILGGPALFLAGRLVLQYLVFDRVSRSRVGGLLALLCLAPAMLLVAPLVIALGRRRRPRRHRRCRQEADSTTTGRGFPACPPPGRQVMTGDRIAVCTG